jgi:hypothetical protein
VRHKPLAFYLERLRDMSLRRGGALLSRHYIDDATLLRFRCAERHEWMQAPGKVKQGRWCPQCAIARRAAARKAPAIAKLRLLVARRGGVIVAPDYVNSQTKLLYRCAQGHEWETGSERHSPGPLVPDMRRAGPHQTKGPRVGAAGAYREEARGPNSSPGLRRLEDSFPNSLRAWPHVANAAGERGARGVVRGLQTRGIARSGSRNGRALEWGLPIQEMQ